MESEYEKMRNLAHRIKAQIVLIHIPQCPPWNDSAAYPGQRLAQWCANHDVAFVDTLPALKGAAKDTVLYWKKDGHCTAEGYKVIAETVYSALLEKGFVP